MAFKFDAATLTKGLSKLESKTDLAVRSFADTNAKKMEAYAKTNARWTNRTGTARNTLQGYVTPLANGYRMNIAHGVNYGVWLELAHEKKYAILPDTVNYAQSQIAPAFTRLLERL